MAFKDFLQQDIDNVFFNTEEFAEPHMINGRSVNVVIDTDKAEKLASSGALGINVRVIVYYAKTGEFSRKPKIEDVQDFDDGYYQVADVQEENGAYVITLRGSES